MSKGFCKWAVLVCLGLLVSAAAVAEENASATESAAQWQSQGLEKAERLALATQIMAERERRAGRAFDKAWAERWVETLSQRDLASLKGMLEAVEAGVEMPLKEIGDTTGDLVFTPLTTSCLVLDTRVDDFSGNVEADVTYPFIVAGDLTLAFDQGGLGNCGVPFGPAVAVVANIIAVDPEGKGNMQVWDWSTAFKGNSVINFGGPQNNENLINGIMVPICNPSLFFCDFDLNTEVNFTDSDIVFNVTGYFSAPEPTPLDCVTVSETKDFDSFFGGATVNPMDLESGDCPTGYSLTGGGHNWTSGSTDVWFWQVAPNATDTGYRCRGFVDRAGSTSQITCYARCCRVPGL